MTTLIRPSFHALSLAMLACACMLVAQTINTYAITRHDVENTLANMGQLLTQARVVPSFTNGASRGFKLLAMRPDSFFTRLGLKNGDALQRVNGFTLDSPTSALEAFTQLRSASRIEIELERDGQPVRKTYSIEP